MSGSIYKESELAKLKLLLAKLRKVKEVQIRAAQYIEIKSIL